MHRNQMDERLPEAVRQGFDGWTASVAYHYGDRPTTWRLERADETVFVKVGPGDHHPTLADERDRLEWAGGRFPVPRVIGYGFDEGAEWLLLSPLSGVDATNLTDDPKTTVRILGEGLREFHAFVDPAECPFDFRVDAALAHVRGRLESGLLDSREYEHHSMYAHMTGAEMLAQLEATRPDVEDLVVCHGDYCFPNVTIEHGSITGYLDLGELGVADRWWDLACGTWTCEWNVGSEWEDLFLEAYGVERDPERQAFYRLLYDVAS